MDILLVVHGTTVENECAIHQGSGIEGILSARGKEEVEQLSEALKHETIDFALLSPLARCKDTFDAIARYHASLGSRTSKYLRAKNSGKYEGLPQTVFRADAAASEHPIYDFKPLGSESTRDQQNRIVGFFNTEIPKLNYKKLLIVTHGGIVTTLGLHLNNRSFGDYDSVQPAKASISRLNYTEGKVEVRSWSDTTHITH